MRRPVTFLLAMASIWILGWTTLAPSEAQSPIGLYGTWSSTRYAGSGGAIQLTNLAVSGDGALAGRIFFTGSPCAEWAVFSGRLYGDSASLAMNIGPCGPTEVWLRRQGYVWVGTYQSAYPDAGVIQMVP